MKAAARPMRCPRLNFMLLLIFPPKPPLELKDNDQHEIDAVHRIPHFRTGPIQRTPLTTQRPFHRQ